MRRALLAVLLIIVAAPAMAWQGASVRGIAPAIGRPGGGEIIRITGSNFTAPVRVWFDTGGPHLIEALLVSVTPMALDVVTPPVLMTGQQMIVDVIVHAQAGTAFEQRVRAEKAFTFRSHPLTPKPATASPNHGSLHGETHVTIFGEGFEPPVQVLFRREGFAPVEARVFVIDFDQIRVLAPDGPSLGAAAGVPVDIEILNINSQTRAVLPAAFRYLPDPLIAHITPAAGPAAGGTVLRISGAGFIAPVEVLVAGIRAQAITVTQTEIVVKTGAATVPRCGILAGPVVVTNIASGETFSGPPFTYVAPRAGCVDRVPPSRAER